MKLFLALVMLAVNLVLPVRSQTALPAIDLPEWMWRASAEARGKEIPPLDLRRPYESLEGLTDEQRANYLNWVNENLNIPQQLSRGCWLFPKQWLHLNVYRAPGIYFESEIETEAARESLGVVAPKRNGVSVEPILPKRGHQ